MKNRIKILFVVLAALAILALPIAGFAAGSYTKDFAGTVTVNVATVPNLDLYSNPACTAGVSSISFSAVTQGQATSYNGYVQNDGTDTVSSIIISAIGLPSGLTFSYSINATSLAPGANTSFSVTLTAASNATTGANQSLTIVFSGSAA